MVHNPTKRLQLETLSKITHKLNLCNNLQNPGYKNDINLRQSNHTYTIHSKLRKCKKSRLYSNAMIEKIVAI